MYYNVWMDSTCSYNQEDPYLFTYSKWLRKQIRKGKKKTTNPTRENDKTFFEIFSYSIKLDDK